MRTGFALGGLTLVLFGLPGCGVLETEGWQSTHWGMTERDVRRVLARFSAGPCTDSYGSDAKVCVNRYLMEKRIYVVSLHFDEETKGLYSVKVRSGYETDEFTQLVLAGLTQKFGNATNCLPSPPPRQEDREKPKLDICYKWSGARNIVSFEKYSRTPAGQPQQDWHVVTYSRGPVTLIERL